ncbi:MAG TPA: hypothetical protein EYN93_10935 [Planctomycetaceae bacterium]|nr:hypothetical protein [Planctomycetaceae bacterium]
MGGSGLCGIVLVVAAVLVGVIGYFYNPKPPTETDSTEDSPSIDIPKSWQKQYEQSPGVTPVPSHSVASVAKTVGSFDLLNRLPFAFYLLGIIGGFILFGFTVATAAESSTAETGAMFGYTIGASLSIIGFGRIIEVLQQIRDK